MVLHLGALTIPGLAAPTRVEGYRSLLPKDVDGLLVTGKSAGPFLHIVTACACTGHAAGVAAGLAATAGQTPRQLDVDLLQKTLLEQGAVL